MKIIWLTDLHLLPNGRSLLGHDCTKRLKAAVNYINQHHNDADYCVISGDLTDEGDAASYQLVRDIMTVLPIPTLSIPGNHDNREVMRSQLSFPENIHPNFIQYSVIKNGQRLILLDSLQENNADGYLCDERLDWLESELSKHKELPTLVFCHHPPGKLFLPVQDQEQHNYGDKLLDKLCAAPNIGHLFFGHVHRPISGNFRGLSFTALQSIGIQVPLPYPAWDWTTFTPTEEAPAIAIIHSTPDSVVVHSHAFCKPTDYVLSN